MFGEATSLPCILIDLILVCSDSDYTEPDNVKGNYEWPVTLPPKLLRDGFQIQPSEVITAVSPVSHTDFYNLRPVSPVPSPPPSTPPSPTSPPGRWGRRPSPRRTSWSAATW